MKHFTQSKKNFTGFLLAKKYRKKSKRKLQQISKTSSWYKLPWIYIAADKHGNYFSMFATPKSELRILLGSMLTHIVIMYGAFSSIYTCTNNVCMRLKYSIRIFYIRILMRVWLRVQNYVPLQRACNIT